MIVIITDTRPPPDIMTLTPPHALHTRTRTVPIIARVLPVYREWLELYVHTLYSITHQSTVKKRLWQHDHLKHTPPSTLQRTTSS